MKTILFLHGFFASGSCVPANALKDAFAEKARVLTPDLPIHPKDALEYIHKICDKENPDLLVGNSCGSFYAQILDPIVGIPALLGNPHFKMTEFLKERIGSHKYKSARADGKQDFEITEELIKEFEEIEQIQFNFTSPYYKDKVWGIFGEQDTLAHFEQTFLEHYNNAYHFPGAHTPTADEVRTWHVPLIEKMLMTFEKPETRYFQHFKGGKYKFIRTAFDSETQERMVVYQALYGEQAYWVRPEKMFFEKVTRENKTFNRFTEIEELQKRLVAMQDKEYALFQAKLTPGIPMERFIGVRVPLLRQFAKTYIKEDESKEFLNQLPHEYYDEDMLHGLLISLVKNYDRCIEQTDRFLPYIDNWAVCDIMSPKVFAKHKKELLVKIKQWSKSSHTYTCRFGLEILMTHYLDDDFRPEYLDIVAAARSEEYYVKMMVSWFFATALAKQWDATIPYLQDKRLATWTHNKTIQKACESYRITPEQKEYLKTLRIK